MYVGLKQPRGDGERYVTPARATAKETRLPASVSEISLRSSPEGTCRWGHLNSFSKNSNARGIAQGGKDVEASIWLVHSN